MIVLQDLTPFGLLGRGRQRWQKCWRGCVDEMGMMETVETALDKKNICFVFLVFAGLGAMLYANTLDVPFYFDDLGSVLRNVHIRLSGITLPGLWQAVDESRINTRPLANISFALNYSLHQYQLAGYHVVNIAVHVLTGFFLTLLLQCILRSPALVARYGRHARFLALAAAVLWFVNPVHTQSVTYIVQRMNSMAAMFYVLSLVLFLRGRRMDEGQSAWPWLAGSALAGLLALATKEIAVTLPIMMFLCEWYFWQDLDKAWLRRCTLYILAMLVFAGLAALLFLGGNPLDAILSGYASRDFTLPGRILTQLRVVVYYLGLLVFPSPSRLCLDYDFALSRSFLDPPTTAISGLVILLLSASAVVFARRARLFSFAVVWFMGNLLLESSLLPLEIIFEHRTYLPSMFLSLLVVAAGYRFIREKRIAIVLFAGIIGLFSYWTVARNEMWREPLRFWTDCVAKSPNKSRPHSNLSVALRKSGQWERAFVEAMVALRLDSQSFQNHGYLGDLYADKQMWELAETEYWRAIRLNPEAAKVYERLGNIYVEQQKFSQAAGFFEKTIAIKPNSVRARTNLASILALQGREQEAVAEFEKARDLSPENSDIQYNLGLAYEKLGRYRDAGQAFSEAVRLNSADRQAAGKLAEVRGILAAGR